MQLRIDLAHMSEDAEGWWRSLTPSERGVYMQAFWEREESPLPRTDRERREVANEIAASR